MIAFLAIAVAVGLAAGAGIGYLVFDEKGDSEGDYLTFYFYDDSRYSTLYTEMTTGSFTPIQIDTFYKLDDGEYVKYGDGFNPYSGGSLNTNLYGLIPGTNSEYQAIEKLFFYDASNYIYTECVAGDWASYDSVYYEGIASYVEHDVVDGIWVKGYGDNTLDCFKDAVKRAGYTCEFSTGSYLSKFNDAEDGNFCVLAWYNDAWTNSIEGNNFSLDIDGMTDYVAVGHGAWDSAMFSPPLPDQTPEDIVWVI